MSWIFGDQNWKRYRSLRQVIKDNSAPLNFKASYLQQDKYLHRPPKDYQEPSIISKGVNWAKKRSGSEYQGRIVTSIRPISEPHQGPPARSQNLQWSRWSPNSWNSRSILKKIITSKTIFMLKVKNLYLATKFSNP